MKLNTKKEIRQYVGDTGQLFGIRKYVLTDGRSKGVNAIHINNGVGLEFTVLLDRCLDISDLSFKGINCSYLSKTGIVAPEYFEFGRDGFLRNFFAGFLTTCGLRNVGIPSTDQNETHCQHGRIGNIAGEEICANTTWEDDVPVMSISGKMREAVVFGEHLTLSRKIICKYGENRIIIRNTVENLGFRNERLMLLFHFNLGYPLLDEDAILISPTEQLTPRNAEAEKGVADYRRCQKPTPGYQEQVFFHRLKADTRGNTSVALVNKKIQMALKISFNTHQFFNFTQWKQMGEGEYVMGLEPCNCCLEGRADAQGKEIAEYLAPGELRNFDITIDLLSGEEAEKLI
ncbi:MAG: hypothetical protein EZS26_002371 [Candidatus Ordinivivax streblomastigis]|uniref:DUF4432 family protein n=1 Tax=Candidatus Ordinivivax streblomastigis TaxID=2540710 RepID=A0A5M8NZA9_9BACT|nr:MAG: hypothetical protein EZS26_002371 [Candidatus Ordinivivax streblomastigis]